MHVLMLGLTSMPYRFFLIPVRQSVPAEEELNRFLRSHRVLNVDRRWVDEGSESFWSFCVDYLETGQDGRAAQGGASERGRVDYREVLSPEQFALFVKLRALRQGIANDEAVPVYMVFTNEQVAQGARQASHEPTLWPRQQRMSRKRNQHQFPRLCQEAIESQIVNSLSFPSFKLLLSFYGICNKFGPHRLGLIGNLTLPRDVQIKLI